jgi:hypothetical protein
MAGGKWRGESRKAKESVSLSEKIIAAANGGKFQLIEMAAMAIK